MERPDGPVATPRILGCCAYVTTIEESEDMRGCPVSFALFVRDNFLRQMKTGPKCLHTRILLDTFKAARDLLELQQ